MRRLAIIGLTFALLGGLHAPAGADPATVDQAPAADEPLGTGDGYLPADEWRARQDAYLAYATETTNLGSVPNFLAHLERAERDPGYDFDATAMKPSHIADQLAKIDAHADTSDFDMMRLMLLWWGHHDQIDPTLRAALEERFVGFRYWYTDPLPDGVVDDKWFWSENHRLIFHTLEYLAGRALPDETFTFTGETGAFHAARGEQRIEEWLDEHAAWGFSEWHSDVYYAKDVEPLLLLTELAEGDLAERAATMLDAFMYDLAVHQRAGNVGVTHGRSYMKDKSKATDQDVFNLVKLAFDTTSQDYTGRGDATVISLARAERYRLPLVIREVAQTTRTFVDRQRMSPPLDLDEPFTTTPVPAAGTAPYDSPDGIPFWWERGALTAWQVVPQTLETIEEHDLLETSLFQPYADLVALTGGDPVLARGLAHGLRCMINVGVLSEVDTITWRSAHAMLSTAQDFRPGCHGNQYHAWQATLDEDAIVFTTNPGNEPRPGNRWVDGDLYWNGGSTMPRSAQSDSAMIAMYAPQFAAQPNPPLDAFNYLDYTHAYFPTERFDEVVQEGAWTFGRRGDGYVALYSWRPTEWRTHDPAETFTNGLTEPFDLVAPGGADNVWITEVGDVDGWGSFEAFKDAVLDAPVTVTDRGDAGGLPLGFDVTYASPSAGTMSFGWTGPLTVDGSEVDLHGGPRIDNPFGTVEHGSPLLQIAEAGATLQADLLTGERVAEVEGETSADEAFVRAVHQDFLGRAPTDTELATEVAALAAGGSRASLINRLSSSDEWLGQVVRDLYQQALGRAPDTGGLAYWIDVLRSGERTVVKVAASIYASPEHLSRSGGTLESWVPVLYADLLGRTPGPAETDYWVDQAERRSRSWVAAAILGAPESREARVRGQYDHFLGRAPEAAGLDYWSDRVGREGDLALARSLAGSSEYLARAIVRFG